MSRMNLANLKKTIYYLRRNGLRKTYYAAMERLEERKQPPYTYLPPSQAELAKQCANLPEGIGVISILVPAYRTKEEYLRELVDSLLAQTYPYWELVMADATEDDSVKNVLSTYGDERIRYVKLEENAGIAENSNQGLQHVSGEYVGLLDHDDLLTPDALYEMAMGIASGADMVYSDEDKCNGDATRFYEPHRKEKFNLDLILSNNYICHFLVMKTALIKELGFRKEYDGAQDYDLILRGVEKILSENGTICHVPKVLYHWRCHEASTAQNPRSKQYAYEAGLRALQDFADRQGWKAKAEHLEHLGFYKLTYIGDIFTEREDIGAVGGPVIRNNRIVGGRMTEEGEIVYEGLHASYSGYLHRAVLTQNCDAVDIRCIRVRTECIPLFEKITGVTYKKDSDLGFFDWKQLPEETDYCRVSLTLCEALRKEGYRILYLPSLKKQGGNSHE